MLYPCDVEHHRAAGPQATIYPCIADGIRADRRKLRLCTRHFPALAKRIYDFAIPSNQEMAQELALICVECGRSAQDAEWQFFATVYPVGSDRQDFWALVHDACHEAAQKRWCLPE